MPVSARINLHLPPEASGRHSHGIQITDSGVVQLFDLSAAKAAPSRIGAEMTSGPSLTDYENERFGELLLPRADFHPRVIFGDTNKVIAVGHKEIEFTDLTRPDIFTRQSYPPKDQRATKISKMTGLATQTVALAFLSNGLYSTLIDPRLPAGELRPTLIYSATEDSPISAFDVLRPYSNFETVKQRPSLPIVVTNSDHLWYSRYLDSHTRKQAKVKIGMGGNSVVDLKSSLNGWFHMVVCEKTIKILDFRSVTSILTHPRTLAPFKPNEWEIKIESLPFPDGQPQRTERHSIIKCEFHPPEDPLPRSIYVVCKCTIDGRYHLFKINIRASMLTPKTAHPQSQAVTWIEPPSGVRWDSLSEIECWDRGFWYPAVEAITAPGFFDMESPGLSAFQPASPHQEDELPEGNDTLMYYSYSSLEKRHCKDEPFVLTLNHATKIFQGRDSFQNQGYGPLLYFFAKRMRATLSESHELLKKRIFSSRDDLHAYCRKWESYFGTHIPNFNENYDTKLVGSSFSLVQRSSSERKPSVVYKEPELGCLAISLKFLIDDGINGAESPFTKLTSILFAQQLLTPLVLPVFSALAENPGLYLSSNPPGELKRPGQRYNRSIPDGMVEIQAPENFEANFVDHYIQVSVPILSRASLQQACHPNTDLSEFPEVMEMFIPKRACRKMWWDEKGNLKASAFDESEIQYPVCVPSREADQNWQLSRWAIGDCESTCLVLFVRPSQFKTMSDKLNANAVFVIVPLKRHGYAYAFTREQIRQWATALKLPFIFALDDNISAIWTVTGNEGLKTRLGQKDWIHVFRALSTHSNSRAGESERVAVWGLRRYKKFAFSKTIAGPWLKRHCQCFMLLNIRLLDQKKIIYERKEERHREILGNGFESLGPVEDFLLNFACEGKKCQVLQNQYYVFQKVERKCTSNK